MDNENDNQQQDNQQTEQVSTGNEQWDKIIDNAAGFGTGDKGDDNADKTQQRGTSADGTQQGDKTQQRGQQQDRQQQNDNRTQQRQGTGEDQGTQQTRSAARKFGEQFYSDAQGNIFDARGGLIAKQGGQRAIFHRLYPTIEAQERELAGLRQTVKNYTDANEIAKRENLTLDEHGAALQMFASYKKDPIKTLQTLLTLAEQGGRDISSIRQGQGVGVADIRSAVQEIVQEAIKPFSFLTEQQRERQEQQADYDAVTTEYNAFLEDFPDARLHEGAIAAVMRDKHVNHREAYFAVRAFAAENGLDWKKSLPEQIEARVAQQQGRRPSGDGNNRRPLPHMNGRNRNDNAHVEDGAMDQANASDSWDAIARRAMAKHGIQV